MEGPELVRTQKKEEVLPTCQTPATSGMAAAAWLLFGASLLLLGLGGAALLIWWALEFHPSNEQLWMVPVSLVLLGTPMIAWLSIFTSSACQSFDMMHNMQAEYMRDPVLVVQTEK
jgi:Putative AtpZ or ATP-synthase-associated